MKIEKMINTDQFTNRLNLLKDYMTLRIDWDIEFPLPSFAAYCASIQDDPYHHGWLQVLLAHERLRRQPVAKAQEPPRRHMTGVDVAVQYALQNANIQRANRRVNPPAYSLFGNLIGI